MATIDIGRIKIVWRGTFNPIRQYSKDDAVFFNGSTFIALDTSTGVQPASGQHWDIMAQGYIPGQTPLTLTNIAALYNFSTTSLAQGQVVSVDGYYTQNDRGGGPFIWDNTSSAVDDAGSTLQPVGLSGNGRWIRLLNGERPNVKMWGAFGDGTSNDLPAISAAIGAMRSGYARELVFTAGTYAINNSIIFPSNIKLIGEGDVNSTTIFMLSGNSQDMLVTNNAATIPSLTASDDGLIIDNLNLTFQSNTTNSALVVCQPGDGHALRNIVVNGGGIGLRCRGIGVPGLRIHNFTHNNPALAAIKIEPLSALSAVGQVSLDGLAIKTANGHAGAGVWLSRVAGNISINNLEAYGTYDIGSQVGGVVFWDVPTLQNGETAGQLSIDNSSNQGDGAKISSFVVLSASTVLPLSAGSQRVPAVKIGSVALQNCNAIINDYLTVYTLSTQGVSGNQFGEARTPFTYEVDSANDSQANRVIRITKADTITLPFAPTQSGWFRIFRSKANNIVGNFGIATAYDSSNFEIYHNATTSLSAYGLIKCNRYVRTNTSNSALSSIVNIVRTIYNTSGELFLDIFLGAPVPIGKPIILTHRSEGRDSFDSQGFCPPVPIASVDPVTVVSYNQLTLGAGFVQSGGNFDAGRIKLGENSIWFGKDNVLQTYNGGVQIYFAPGLGSTGTGATARAFLNNGAIEYVQITNGGSGYTVAPLVYPVTKDFPASSTVTAVLSALVAGGSVTGIRVLNGGSGYGVEPTESGGHVIQLSPENRFSNVLPTSEVIQVSRTIQASFFNFTNTGANNYILNLGLVGPGIGFGIHGILFPGDRIIDSVTKLVYEVDQIIDFTTVALKTAVAASISVARKFYVCSWEIAPCLADYAYTITELPSIMFVPTYTNNASYDSNAYIPNRWLGASGNNGITGRSVLNGYSFLAGTKGTTITNIFGTQLQYAILSWNDLATMTYYQVPAASMFIVQSPIPAFFAPYAAGKGIALDFAALGGTSYDVATQGSRFIFKTQYIKTRKAVNGLYAGLNTSLY